MAIVMHLRHWLILLLTVLMGSCTETHDPTFDPDSFAAARSQMVAEQIGARDVRDPRVLAAMREVPRHLFVLPTDQPHAYDDGPRPIGTARQSRSPTSSLS